MLGKINLGVIILGVIIAIVPILLPIRDIDWTANTSLTGLGIFLFGLVFFVIRRFCGTIISRVGGETI